MFKNYIAVAKVVKAVQISESNIVDIAGSLGSIGALDYTDGEYVVRLPTIEGLQICGTFGDWVVKAPKEGCYDIVKDSVFRENYINAPDIDDLQISCTYGSYRIKKRNDGEYDVLPDNVFPDRYTQAPSVQRSVEIPPVFRLGYIRTSMVDAVSISSMGIIDFSEAIMKPAIEDRETVGIFGSNSNDGTYIIRRTGIEHVYKLYPLPPADEVFAPGAALRQGGCQYLNASLSDPKKRGRLNISGAFYDASSNVLDFTLVSMENKPYGLKDRDNIVVRNTTCTNGMYMVTEIGEMRFTLTPAKDADEVFPANAEILSETNK